jgi:hypothetical protein
VSVLLLTLAACGDGGSAGNGSVGTGGRSDGGTGGSGLGGTLLGETGGSGGGGSGGGAGQGGEIAICGNGNQEQGEECDPGDEPSDACAYGETSCTVCDMCELVPGQTFYCGDDTLDPEREECEGDDATSCDEGFSCSECECAITGTITLGKSQAYDFRAGVLGTVAEGDFYVTSSVDAFWANNLAQEGLVDLGVTTGSLQAVAIPAGGYDNYGVPIVLGNTYVSPARNASGYFIVFRVTSFTAETSVTIDWVYVRRS